MIGLSILSLVYIPTRKHISFEGKTRSVAVHALFVVVRLLSVDLGIHRRSFREGVRKGSCSEGGWRRQRVVDGQRLFLWLVTLYSQKASVPWGTKIASVPRI
jgi:hypothetical protein